MATNFMKQLVDDPAYDANYDYRGGMVARPALVDALEAHIHVQIARIVDEGSNTIEEAYPRPEAQRLGLRSRHAYRRRPQGVGKSRALARR
jgi:hypothetical protein